ncbi:hypothetical protein NQ317_018129 [Molorchus minor]|uniref:Bardet-Biedl syndrome 2 protein homolog n=1 Tax=Molorchus minor TaxID=1323400 RepID=A0ABQ9IV22_9CUCU|nr:hypothetical protein NQ317_018129 [Molorchus minor]
MQYAATNFTLELNYKIVPGLVTLGKYDGTHPSITAATSTDKVLIHSPHKKNVSTSGRMIWSETNREIATLNINHSITCLATGILNPKDGKDVLVIGINTHILVYNVHDNKDIFYKECQDGAKSLAIGTFNGSELPLVMVGGNSSVHGFDTSGREIFWTAFGEVITSLVLMDFTKSGLNELIVASEDFNIRIFKGNQVLATLVETEMVTNLIPLPEHRLAYSVSNGTVGVYEQEKRLWRIKKPHLDGHNSKTKPFRQKNSCIFGIYGQKLSVAVFPDEEKCLKLLIDNLSNMEDANLRLGADFTQKLREIGTLVIQAEDSRLCNETEMISFYHELMKLNEDMINEHNIRLRNYTEGVNTMKQINAFLQKTSRLRVGQKSSDILNHCRNAIKTNNIEELINIIRRGET